MRPVLLFPVLVLAGCMSSAPMAPPPPPPAVRVEAEPNPVPVRVETVPAETVPAEPPPTPTMRITERSIYEQDRVAVWTLANGLTVAYAWDDDATGYTYRLSRGESGAAAPGRRVLQIGPPRGVVTGETDRLDDALGSVAYALAEGSTTDAIAVFRGALGWEWIEPDVAATLGAVRRAAAPDARPLPAARIDVEWVDLPALQVVGALIAQRLRAGDDLALAVDPASGTAALASRSSPAPRYALAPASDGEVSQARQTAEPAGLLAALDALFQLPGRFRPARPVSDARALAGQTARVSLGAVNEILARLARVAP